MSSSKEGLSALDKLSVPEREYILTEDADREGDYAARVNAILEFPNQLARRLQDVSEQLNSFRVHPTKASQPRIREAWEVLTEFAGEHLEESNKFGLVTKLYGSCIFDDARNMDFDIALYSLKPLGNLRNELWLRWLRELKEIWPGDGGHVVVVDWYNTKAHLERTMGDKTGKWVVPGIDLNIDYLSPALTGETVSTPSHEDNISMQSAIVRCVTHIPLVGAITIVEIEDAIKVRQERRR